MKYICLALDTVAIALAALSVLIMGITSSWCLLAVIIAAALIVCVFPYFGARPHMPLRLRLCEDGTLLLAAFLTSSVIAPIAYISAILGNKISLKTFIIGALVAVLVEAAVFFDGIIRVYCTSVQLGIKTRVLGVVCGWIPVLNVVMLLKIISITKKETEFEYEKILLDKKRSNDLICKTKYPILLVHGVFFRDSTLLNYWGRIPSALELNGAELYYGDHDSATSVADSGAQLAKRIKEIVDATGCEKVNIIAHSKGGLDARYAVSAAGASDMVASITTINTPHRGCEFADYLLEKIPKNVQQSVASAYNKALSRLGDKNPDFLSAVRDLTKKSCLERNATLPDVPEIKYYSVGSRLDRASGGKFPLNYTYSLAGYFDGDNDGLVSVTSCKWGEDFIMLTPKGKRGISHGDVIDLNRENIDGFDVREFYVGLVSKLREKGM